MARVLVPEKIADAGLDALRAAGHDVDVQLGLSPEELVEAVEGAQALIIRSATTVTSTTVSAILTTTAPLACRAISPVSSVTACWPY